jgi:shikimate dehydrogenase
MTKAGVIGWPISHSRSPLIHGFWLKHHGIAGTYDKTAVGPENLKAFIDGLRSGERVGTNVTLPHKEAAIAFVDEPDDRVRRIGALNTIWREKGKLRATSTDGPGFLASFHQSRATHDIASGPVIILGAGGSVRAIVDELLRAGVDRISISNRTHTRAEALAYHFGSKVQAVQNAELPEALHDTHLLIFHGMHFIRGQQLRILSTHRSLLRSCKRRGHAIITSCRGSACCCIKLL